MPDELREAELDLSFDVPASTFSPGRQWESVKLVRPGNRGGIVFNDIDLAIHDDGTEIFEGDIDLTPDPEKFPHMLGLRIRHGHGQWPSPNISFVCEDALVPIVKPAIEHWESKTPFRFEYGVGSGDYLSFEDKGQCRSKIGFVGGAQLVALSRHGSVGSVIHEIGHAIGLWHEQSRKDRDQYVTIYPANVRNGQMKNFKYHDDTAEPYGAYDLQSAMHYPSTAFSNGNGPTITLKSGALIPPRTGLSDGDIQTLKSLYMTLAWA